MSSNSPSILVGVVEMDYYRYWTIIGTGLLKSTCSWIAISGTLILEKCLRLLERIYCTYHNFNYNCKYNISCISITFTSTVYN